VWAVQARLLVPEVPGLEQPVVRVLVVPEPVALAQLTQQPEAAAPVHRAVLVRARAPRVGPVKWGRG
jgi:hypothetical protein